MPRWGWLEWCALALTFLPAMLFVPGIAKIRVLIRVGVFAAVGLAWLAVESSGRRRGRDDFPARPWLIFCAAYMGLSIFHPFTNSLLSGLAHVVLAVLIFSPAFWVGPAISSRRQVPRLMAILFLCNAASALFGIGQIYRPAIFNPPTLSFESPEILDAMSFTTADGRKVLRPCGLTDTPGGASGAGSFAAIAGLCWALVPMAVWKRVAALGLAAAGMAAVYFTQVRMMAILTGLSLVGTFALLIARREFRRATTLGLLGAGVMAGTLGWAVATGGDAIVNRFETLWKEDAGSLYRKNRGGFLLETFQTLLPDYPLGAGLGRWGMVHTYFGDHAAPIERGPIWVEIQVTSWVVDGGAPLLIGYFGAILAAMADTIRIALRSRDRDLGFWAGAAAATNLGIVATCFSFTTFFTTIGIQFWVLAAAVHSADRLSRAAPAPAPGPPAGRPRPAPTAAPARPPIANPRDPHAP